MWSDVLGHIQAVNGGTGFGGTESGARRGLRGLELKAISMLPMIAVPYETGHGASHIAWAAPRYMKAFLRVSIK